MHYIGLTLLAATMGNGVYLIYATVPNKAAGTSLCAGPFYRKDTYGLFKPPRCMKICCVS